MGQRPRFLALFDPRTDCTAAPTYDAPDYGLLEPVVGKAKADEIFWMQILHRQRILGKKLAVVS
ncbi:MAG: hypothetical protein ABSH28_18475 [Acidobacteriota bacterium]|jgi:hypothetical protein